MKCRLVTERNELDGLRSGWHALSDGGPQAPPEGDVTAGWEWTTSLVDAFLPDGGWAVVVAEDERGVAGVLPVYRVARAQVNEVASQVAHIGVLHASRPGLLLRDDDPEVLRVMLDHVADFMPRWAVLDLEVVEGSRAAGALEAVRSTCLASEVVQRDTCLYADMGDDFEVYLQGLKSGFRSELRRRERRLHERGSVELQVFDSAQSVGQFWALVEEVERQSWKHEAGTAITTQPMQERFYRLAVPRLAAAGKLLSAVLTVDGAPVAHRFSVAAGSTALGLKTSYCDEWKAYGPATVMQMLYMRAVHARGVRVFDFTGVADAHKRQWTDREYVRTRRRIYRRSVRGGVLRGRAALAGYLRRLSKQAS